MIFALVSLILFLVLLIVALRVSLSKNKPEEEIAPAMIHASGIYSIVRKSPREIISKVKPTGEEIRKYLATVNVDIGKLPLLPADRSKLLNFWHQTLNENIQEIERGDKEGVEFYYYDFSRDCPVCTPHISKGQFVTREEIFENPSIIPPFHIGCTCKICAHHGKENLRDTTELGMRPLFNKGTPPSLPEWTTTVKLS